VGGVVEGVQGTGKGWQDDVCMEKSGGERRGVRKSVICGNWRRDRDLKAWGRTRGIGEAGPSGSMVYHSRKEQSQNLSLLSPLDTPSIHYLNSLQFLALYNPGTVSW